MPIETHKPEQDPVVTKRDYNDLDELLSEMGVPKQTFEPPIQPGAQPPPGSAQGWQPPYQEPISPEDAKQSGLRIAKTINTTFSFLAGLYAKSSDTQKYKASESEVNDLADPLTEIAEKYNYKISPEIRFIFLLVTIYAPRAIQAANDRRINLLEDRVSKLEDAIRLKEEKLNPPDPETKDNDKPDAE